MKDAMSSYFEDPEFQESLAKYEGMVQNHTPAYFDAEELTDIAEYYIFKGNHEEGNKAIDLALQLHPEYTNALILRVRSLAEQGKLDEAHHTAEQIKDTSDREVQFLKADLLMDEGRMAEADAILQQLAANEEYELDTLLDIIQDYTDVNEGNYAKKWFNMLKESYNIAVLAPRHQRLRDILCEYYAITNQPDLSLPLLQTTLDEHPYSIKHWNELGKCQIQLGHFEAAHEALDFASAIDENNADTLALKAFCFHHTGNRKEASKFYLKLAETSGDITRPYQSLSKLHMETGEYEIATHYLEALLEKRSKMTNYELAEIYCNAAICHAMLGHDDKGNEYLTIGTNLNEHDPETHIARGRFMLITAPRSKRRELTYDMATYEFEQALNLVSKDERMDILLSISTACFDSQNYDYTIRYLETLNKEYPEMTHFTYLFLIYCYFYTRQDYQFLHYLAKMKQEYPDMFAQLGTTQSIVADECFNEVLCKIIDDIHQGNLDLNMYL